MQTSIIIKTMSLIHLISMKYTCTDPLKNNEIFTKNSEICEINLIKLLFNYVVYSES